MRYFYLLLLCMITSCNQSNADFDLQGHRGAAGLMPENSVPSFLKAIDLGVNTVEFDVVISADDQVVISHEPWFRREICSTPEGKLITRNTEMDYNIFELTYEEIKLFDCGSHGNPDHPEQERIAVSKPLMLEAIHEMELYVQENNLDPVNYSIEIKSRPEWDSNMHPKPGEFVQLVYDELLKLNITDRVIIQSFDVRALQKLRSLDPTVTQSFLVSLNRFKQENLALLGYVPEIYSPHYRLVNTQLIERSRELGMKVIPWTVNDPGEMKRLIEMGVDGLITDYPNRYQELGGLQVKSETNSATESNRFVVGYLYDRSGFDKNAEFLIIQNIFNTGRNP